MELVDVVDSKSTAGNSVPVRVRPPAPRRSKLCIACSDFFSKVRARSRRCSSSPNRTRCRWASFGFFRGWPAESAQNGENQSYKFTLQTVVGETSEEEKHMQKAMLLSFCLDENSHVLNIAPYTPGQAEWGAAMAGLAAEKEPIWFSWYHDEMLTEIYGKGDPDYLTYVMALEDFYPEEFTETFFGEKPEGAEMLAGDPIPLCLPGMGIWLYFYSNSPWVEIIHADGEYWARFCHKEDPDEMIFDTVHTWLEAEIMWAAGS